LSMLTATHQHALLKTKGQNTCKTGMKVLLKVCISNSSTLSKICISNLSTLSKVRISNSSTFI
jgi:hypothetical protein